MNNELLAELIDIRRRIKKALGALDGEFDENFKEFACPPENYREGVCKDNLLVAHLKINALLSDHDAALYEMDARADNLTDREMPE